MGCVHPSNTSEVGGASNGAQKTTGTTKTPDAEAVAGIMMSAVSDNFRDEKKDEKSETITHYRLGRVAIIQSKTK